MKPKAAGAGSHWRRRTHAGLALILAWAWAWACQDTQDRGSGRVAVNQTDESTQCIGRFQFSVDPSVVVTGRNQRIYRVEVSTIPLKDTDADAIWRERLGAIRATARRAAAKDPVVRTFDLDPGVTAVWFHANSTDESFVTLEVMKPYRDHVLHLVREITSGAEAVTEKMYRRVIAGYVPHGRRGFCVGLGALVSEVSKNEQTLIAFMNPALADLEVSFASNTVDQPDDADAIHDIEEERKILMESDTAVVISRNERRTVAQLPGVEARIQLTPRGEKPLVRFTWRFAGVGGSPSAPQLVLIGTALLEHQAQLNAVWEKLLGSLQAVPLPPG